MIEINLYAWLVEQTGINGIYVSMALFLIAAATLVHWLPQATGRQSQTAKTSSRKTTLAIVPWVCLTAVFLFYVATGAFWAYVERIGRNGGLAADFVTGSLTYTQVLSLLGCVFAGWLSSKLGQFRPLIASLLFAASASYILILGVNNISFVAALCLFFFFWNAIDIYQLGTLGNLDESGRFVALVPAFQTTAVSLGPALAALLLGSYNGYQLVLAMTAAAILLAAILYGGVFLVLRRRNLEQFDAA
jgi:predicted MFS family arabinose efflux permease